jgi:hypothetical protein
MLIAGQLYLFPADLTSKRLCEEKIAEAQAAFTVDGMPVFVVGWCTKLPDTD